ncbi:sugar porter family MFS transporter [Vibrio viridaestus]|uniref:MFS transporter n=1 Tax=Vibrio viridaestus TaxID=2487322 RepID=A0A3N9TJ71_9VIBR|nr:sugar porter family MFS transporter [Vibrio viridaestus]RQW64201.1 MFS transporter [Vibrio viridaestus]
MSNNVINTRQGDTNYSVKYILFICGVAALGGLLLGYDTAVISGAINPIRDHFQLSSIGVGWAVSNVAIGCIIGAFWSGPLSRKYGRKKSLIFSALLYTISAAGSALATSFFWFVIFRMIGGLAVGIASSVSPMYMSEVSPKQIRGRAVGMQNFAIVGGQVVIFIVNFSIARGMSADWLNDVGWRIMIGSETIPCILFMIFSLLIPESPRWLMMMNRKEEAKQVLIKIFRDEGHAATLMQQIDASNKECESKSVAEQKRSLYKEKLFWMIVIIACGVSIFGQASGVNVFLYYAPVILERVTGSNDTALFLTIFIGITQLIGTTTSAFLMDKVGRVPLLKFGSLGSAAGLLLTSYFLYQSHGLTGEAAINMGYWTLGGMAVFMICFSLSWALGAWLVVSEMFPNRMRSVGMGMAIGAVWVSNFIIGLAFPVMNDSVYLNTHFKGAFPMWVFAVCMILAYLFVRRYVPETKGIPLEEMEQCFIEKQQQYGYKKDQEVEDSVHI